MDSSLLVARILYIVMWLVFIVVIVVFISTICSHLIIDVSNYTITSAKLPKDFDGYKILQISDLHDASFGKNNSKLLKKINEINPDIIVITGDMVNTKTKNFNNFYSFISSFSKKYPSYYIMGNHEMRMTTQSQMDIMRNLNALGVKVLDNSEDIILKDNESIRIYGLNQPITTYKNALKNNVETNFTLANMEVTFPFVDNSSFNILLSHSPFDFEIFEKWGADLVLAGHVHGGLIRLPFVGGVLSPERKFFPSYDAGEYTIDDSTLIVSRGLGNGTINLRVFNNPELCVITLNNSEI